MNHYITPDNKTYGFDDTQTSLIPSNAVLIPANFTMEQIPYLTLENGTIVFNQAKYDSDKLEAEAQANAKIKLLEKLIALGLTEEEINSLIK